MRHYTFALLSAAALGLAACGGHKSDDQTANSGTDQTVTNVTTTSVGGGNVGSGNMGGTATNGLGQTFADTAAASDAFEIQSSELARTAAHSPAVKSFASKMIEAHTASTAELKKAAASANPPITPHPAMTSDQQQMLTGLQGKKGAEFDTAYAQAQVTAHQATLDALRQYSTSGDVPQLKALATKMIPTVTAHLNMAKGLK